MKVNHKLEKFLRQFRGVDPAILDQIAGLTPGECRALANRLARWARQLRRAFPGLGRQSASPEGAFRP